MTENENIFRTQRIDMEKITQKTALFRQKREFY